jgi:hypothetical protein
MPSSRLSKGQIIENKEKILTLVVALMTMLVVLLFPNYSPNAFSLPLIKMIDEIPMALDPLTEKYNKEVITPYNLNQSTVGIDNDLRSNE